MNRPPVPSPDILTARLRLVAFTLPAVEAAARDDRTEIACLLGIRVPGEWPQPDFAEILPVLRSILIQHPQAVSRTRLIVHATENVVIGDIGFFWTDTPVWEFGYAILPEYRGNGYATEAAKGLIDWGFSTYPKPDAIVAECESDNFASARVLEKVGLSAVGRKDTLVQWRLERSQ